MRWIFACGATAVFLAFPIEASACQGDRDCPAASRCVKSRGQLYGVCERGLPPINGSDRRPVGDPLNPKGTLGKACQFDTDCISGLRCVAQSNTSQGVCRR